MSALTRLNAYFWQYKRLFIPGLLCAVVSAVFTIVVPIVVREAVDSIPRFVSLYNLYEGTAVQGYFFALFGATLLVFGLVVIALSLLSGVFSFLMRRTLVVASRHIEFDLRNALYAHVQTLSQRFYQQYSTGDVITRATSDIEQVRRYVGPALMYSTRAIVIMVTAIAVMFIISPTLTLYALIPMPFLALSVFFVARMVHARSDALQAQYSSLTSRVQEALSGIRVLKAYTREEAEAAAFETESARYRTRTLDLAKVDAAWRPVFLMLVGMSTIIVVWIGGRLVMQGAITIGNIAEYIIYVALMTWPVASVGFVITMVQRASASMIRLNQIFDTPPDIADGEQTDHTIQQVAGGIAFEHVSFRYEAEGPWVLEDIDFAVPAGATLALVGRTGAGKSTLVEMIPRLLEPTRGRVLIDGRDVREIPLQVLRASAGYVPQEVFLFSDTVANNIAFGVQGASRETVEEAAREAELLDNVRDFPDGFETFVGERGITLSGGQKQRTSIARALIRDPRILILDDALSAVDTNTESLILGHLRKHYGKRTIVIVSHRISAVQHADLILVLDEGRIVERGAHDELVLQEGLYADLYRKQLLEQEIEALT
jgi:ATP-binding cassette subfamily B multidrug efflux pump